MAIVILNENGVSIWDEWADENGDLVKYMGYSGENERKDNVNVDQIKFNRKLKNDPDSRRHIVSAWNVGDNEMALPHAIVYFNFI